MATDRPYRARCSLAQSIANLRRQAGVMFDPGLVELFLSERLYEMFEYDEEESGSDDDRKALG